MITLAIGLAVGFPVLVIFALAWIRSAQRRDAVTSAARILDLEIDFRGMSMPELAGEVEGVDVRVEKSPRNVGALAKTVGGLMLDQAISHRGSGLSGGDSAKTYKPPYGPVTVVVSPYGLPPEVTVEPSQRRRYGPIEHDDKPLKVNFEDTFEITATHEAYASAIVDNEEVMRLLWSLHKQFRSIRCRNGEIHVQIEPLRTGDEIAGDIRAIVSRANEIGAFFEEHPVRA